MRSATTFRIFAEENESVLTIAGEHYLWFGNRPT